MEERDNSRQLPDTDKGGSQKSQNHDTAAPALLPRQEGLELMNGKGVVAGASGAPTL